MTDAVLEELESKAYFVSGKSSWFRTSADSSALSAISDAKNLLRLLKDKISNPLISAGTTSKPERILNLTWFVSGYSSIRAIEISCKGHNKFDVSWDDPAGNKHFQKEISLSGVKLLDIPNKIELLKTHSSFDGRSSSPQSEQR